MTAKPPAKKAGIALLHAALTDARRDAQKIFNMVTEERGSQNQLLKLVRQESIFELINLCVDLTLKTRPVANALKSRRVAILARQQQIQTLHDWLDKNLSRFKGRLDKCAEAASRLPRIARSPAWVRKEITAYRASKKLQAK